MSDSDDPRPDEQARRLVLSQSAAVLSASRQTLASLALVLAELPGRQAAMAVMHLKAAHDNVEDAEKCLRKDRSEWR